MKNKIVFLLAFFPLISFAEGEITHLKTLDETASKYRMMAIECATDVKLQKKALKEVSTCRTLYDFTSNEYPKLKASVVEAEQKVKQEAIDKGLNAAGLRDKLVLIMSAKSHMNIAGSIFNKIN